MFVSKMKTVVGIFMACVLVGTGAGVLAFQKPASQLDDVKQPAAQKAPEK